MPAISYYGSTNNLTDVDKKGKLDFIKAIVESENCIVVEAYGIFPSIKKKQKAIGRLYNKMRLNSIGG